MNYNELQSKTIDFIRFPISIGVVVIHTNYGVGEINSIELLNFSSLSSTDILYIFQVLTKTVATVATPFFFLISGYYYFKGKTFNKAFYLKKSYLKLKTLLIPYIIWNILALGVPLVTSFIKGDYIEYIESFKHINPMRLFWTYKSIDRSVNNLFGHQIIEYFPINAPLWFLRDLLIISLLSPLIYFLIKKTGSIIIIIFSIFYFTNTWFIIPGLSIISIFYFSLGAFLAIDKKNLIEESRKKKYIFILLFFVLLFLDIYMNGTRYHYLLIRPAFRFVALATFLILGSYIYEKKISTRDTKNSYLAKASFFIYVSHTVSILGVTTALYEKLTISNTFLNALIYILIPVTTSVICFCFYAILKHLLPKFTKLITGDR